MQHLAHPMIDFPNDPTRKLYARALDEQWSVSRDVAWDELALNTIAKPVREAMGEVYAQIHFGEVFALRTAGRLVSMAESGWPRQMLATQVIDEARHVEFFSIVLHQLEIAPHTHPAIEALCAELDGPRTIEELCVGTLAIEHVAHAVFVDGAKHSLSLLQGAIRLPGSEVAAKLLDIILSLVGRDEGRHLALSRAYLGELLPRLPVARRLRLEEQARGYCEQLHTAVTAMAPSMRRLALSPSEMRAKVWQRQRHHLSAVGLEIGDAPAAAA